MFIIFIYQFVYKLVQFCKDLYKIKDTNKHYSHFYIFN